MTTLSTPDHVSSLFEGPGASRAACRSVDWSRTPLGPVEDWPEALCAAVRICLDNKTAVAIWAGTEHTLIYNEGYHLALGAKHPAALGRTAAEVWYDVWEQLAPEFARVLERGESTRREEARFGVERGHGLEDAYFTYSLAPIRDSAGRIVGIFNVVEETTRYVRARSQKEELLAFAFESAHAGAWMFDEERGTTERNLEHDRIFGYDQLEREWSIDRFLAHVVPDDRERVAQGLAQSRATRSDWRCECRIRRVDGAMRWVAVSGRFLATAPGEPRRVAGIVQDVTDRKRDEESLRTSRIGLERERARLQAIVDTIPAGLLVLEPDGTLALANDEASRIWSGEGATAPDASGRRMFWPESGQPLREDERPGVRALARGESSKGVVVDIERRDGTRGTIVYAAAPIRDAKGTTTGAVVTLQDISALRAAQRSLELADRRKNDFLAVLSHELRNPLTPIRNSLHVLAQAEPEGPQARRARGVIERQVGQLVHLVDDLLDLTRITRGKVHLRRERVELEALIARSVEDHRALFERAELDVVFERPSSPVFVQADAHRLAQVIGNLLQNAVKFTPHHQRVRVVLAAEAAAHGAVIRVIDTGVGMGPDLIARVFEPFTQADTSLDRSQGGLGLGLALVKGLVEQHGGSVEARSAGVGQGAEFIVRLPLDAGEQLPRDESPSPTTSARARSNARVLVIEDNVDAAESLREVLELNGHETVVAYDGPAGLSAAHTFLPDVVLCDIGLPDMDGYEVARAFRNDADLAGTRLVALSGYAQPDDLRRAAEAGFDRHLAKPPSVEELEQALRAEGAAIAVSAP